MTLRLSICMASAVVLGAVASCSGPGGPAPQAARAIQITPGAGSCSLAPPESTIGEDSFALRRNGGSERIADGDDGVEVACRVAGSDTFSLDAKIVAPRRVRFTVRGEVTEAGGTVTISDWNVNSQASLSSQSCDLNVRFIDEGAIWAQFTCPDFSGSNPQHRGCASEGVFVFENCDKS